jgi:hypothetical protein
LIIWTSGLVVGGALEDLQFIHEPRQDVRGVIVLVVAVCDRRGLVVQLCPHLLLLGVDVGDDGVKKIEVRLDPEQGCTGLLCRLAQHVEDELSLRGGVGGLDWRRGADLLDLADRRKDLQQKQGQIEIDPSSMT